MINSIAPLLSDTYKHCHYRMYPDGTTRLVSYWVPRRSMLKNQDKMVFFGMTAFIKEYLDHYFREFFFDLPEDEMLRQYCGSMNTQIGEGNYDTEQIVALHKLGYLPIAISALPEGTLVPMGVPCIEITNTHSDFAWVVQWLECILQVELWKPCLHATIGYMYRQIANEFYALTVDDMAPEMACADFGMRGMSCMEEAARCSAAWLLSFNKTSTIAAIDYVDNYYNAECAANGIGKGGVSSEHSVAAANYAVYGNEEDVIRHFLVDLYPNTSFSYVSDTYDYWHIVKVVLPNLRKELEEHNGTFLVRPDSGNIVEISVETVKSLWESFGGTINSKGYKLLPSWIRVIYGDGCTLSNVRAIWTELEKLGFAANNIYFGVGAFCFSAIMEDDRLVVATRDTFGIAMKATYAEINGKELPIYKDPKTDTSKLKKSHKGCCVVYSEDGELRCEDEHTWEEIEAISETGKDELGLIYYNGQYISEIFKNVRDRLHG